MKFTSNHPTKFHSWVIPFVMGFMQTQMVTIIELVNLINICANNNIMDIVMNYVALAVVADFDDYIFEAVKRGDNYPELLEYKGLQWDVTTSSQCTHEEDYEKRLTFNERKLGNKIARIVYCICRLIYISVYFYFFEFLTLILIFTFPITYASYYQEDQCPPPIYTVPYDPAVNNVAPVSL